MKIILKRLPHGRDLALPHYATSGSAGLDLIAAVEEEIELLPGQRAAIPCGIAIELPHGYEAQVRPRSGLALNQGVTVLNAPGTIDSDYRGEVKAILINHGAEPYLVKRGAKIAQMVIARHEQAEIVESEALSDSARGAGGFGSTGMAAKT
ncbi:MAG TPA: dUTP diphosphatase [Rhizomicrobium sp.]|jgi:dUTP pyrophosphatase|nr:dUTP diphosphatase [Rhizomicrobium sp.]